MLKHITVVTLSCIILSCSSIKPAIQPPIQNSQQPLPTQKQLVLPNTHQNPAILAYSTPLNYYHRIFEGTQPNQTASYAIKRLKQKYGQDWIEDSFGIHRKDCEYLTPNLSENPKPPSSRALKNAALAFFNKNTDIFPKHSNLHIRRTQQYETGNGNFYSVVLEYDFNNLPVGIDRPEVYFDLIEGRYSVCGIKIPSYYPPADFSIKPALPRNEATRIAKNHTLSTLPKYIAQLESQKKSSDIIKTPNDLKLLEDLIIALKALKSTQPIKAGIVELGIFNSESFNAYQRHAEVGGFSALNILDEKAQKPILAYSLKIILKGYQGGIDYLIDAQNGKIIFANDRHLYASFTGRMHCGNGIWITPYLDE
jgi:hypothetical protein